MIKFVKYNVYRKDKYRCSTLLKNGYFIKRADFPVAIDFLNSLIKKYELINTLDLPFEAVKPIKYGDEIHFKKINGYTLRSILESKLKNQDDKYVLDEILKFIDILSKRSNLLDYNDLSDNDRAQIEKVFGQSFFKEKKWLKIGAVDLIFDNIIIGKNEKKYLIDYEWTWDFPVPVEFVIFRSVYTFLSYMKFKGYDIKNLYEYFSYLFKEKYFKAEYNFLKYVSHSIIDYQDFKENISLYLKKDYSKITFIEDRLKDINNLKILVEEKDKQIMKLEEMRQELQKELFIIFKNNEKLYEENTRLKSILSRRSVRVSIKLANLFRKIINKIKF